MTRHILTLLAPVALASAACAAPDPGVSYADGFDYPVGEGTTTKSPILEGIAPERNDWYPSNPGATPRSRVGWSGGGGWYNAQDVGSYLYLKSKIIFDGIHPGEDWNRSSDVGDEIKCVANGKIVRIKSVTATGNSLGWVIIVKHWLPDDNIYYSLYVHAAPPSLDGVANDKGTIPTNVNKFVVGEGSVVAKGQVIARLGKLVGLSPHLHFEMRDSAFNPSGSTYPNAPGDGYYGSGGGAMTKTQMTSAFTLMRQDGIIDPSDFIDDHRTLLTLTTLPIYKAANPDRRRQMDNCIAMGIMNNTNEQAWLKIERPMSRGELVTILASAAAAYGTGYLINRTNENEEATVFPNDDEAKATVYWNSILLFGKKGLVDVRNPTFRVNAPATFSEAVNLLWQVFELGSGEKEGGSQLFENRRRALQEVLFSVPIDDFDLSKNTDFFSRTSGFLSRNTSSPERKWHPELGIVTFKNGDKSFDYDAPIRRGLLAKMIVNTLIYRASKKADWSLIN